MPVRGGLEATQYLREKKYAIPIYALTAETSKEEVNNALEAGCDGFLSKPLNRGLLFDVLSECLHHAGGDIKTSHSGENGVNDEGLS